MKKLFFILTLLIFASCSDESNARRILEQNGYTEIEITGYEMWCCGQDDSFSTGFKAKSPSGQYVTGCVCSGWGKGGTIRFD